MSTNVMCRKCPTVVGAHHLFKHIYKWLNYYMLKRKYHTRMGRPAITHTNNYSYANNIMIMFILWDDVPYALSF